MLLDKSKERQLKNIVIDEISNIKYPTHKLLRQHWSPLQELPNLEPSRGEVGVKAHTLALNRADIEECKGNYPPPIPSQSEITSKEEL